MHKSRDTWKYESGHTVMIRMHHVTNIIESFCTFEWVMSYMCSSNDTHMNYRSPAIHLINSTCPRHFSSLPTIIALAAWRGASALSHHPHTSQMSVAPALIGLSVIFLFECISVKEGDGFRDSKCVGICFSICQLNGQRIQRTLVRADRHSDGSVSDADEGILVRKDGENRISSRAPWSSASATHRQTRWGLHQRGWSNDACATPQRRSRHELAWIWTDFLSEQRRATGLVETAGGAQEREANDSLHDARARLKISSQ